MTDLSHLEAPMPTLDGPSRPPPVTADVGAPPAPRRRTPVMALAASVLVTFVGLGLLAVGSDARGDASSTRARVDEVRRQTADAETAREKAIHDADAARQKAGSVDTQKDDLDARLKRLSATAQDSVRTANRLSDECFVPWANRRISNEQALACLPDRITDNDAAVDAQAQAVADIRSALAALEGDLSD